MSQHEERLTNMEDEVILPQNKESINSNSTEVHQNEFSYNPRYNASLFDGVLPLALPIPKVPIEMGWQGEQLKNLEYDISQ